MRGFTFSALSMAALASSLLIAPAAQATERNGVCESGEFCFYYNSGMDGAISDHTTSLTDYGDTQPSCYDFKGSGSGAGECIKNNAASVWNRAGTTVRVYYNSDYVGSTWFQDIAPGAKWNLNQKMKNNNASHKFLTTTAVQYPAKNDYPYSGACSGVDPWNFYKGQCTSFAAWAVNSRLSVGFHNYYKGVHWGNAKNWANAAASAGVPVYGSPKGGDVAVRLGGEFGHVAFVTRVNADGTFEVDEYNYGGTCRYGHRTVSVGTANSQFSKFVRLR